MFKKKEKLPTTQRQPNWLGLIFAIGSVFVCALFILPAMLSSNLMFASNNISTYPSEVVLYHQGQVTTYTAQDAEYDVIVASVYNAIGDQTGIEQMGWADDRFVQARDEGTAVELIYSRPVKLPGNRLDIGDVYRLFIPLDVFGFNGQVVFRGGANEYWGAPLRVPSLDAVRVEVDQITGASVTN